LTTGLFNTRSGTTKLLGTLKLLDGLTILNAQSKALRSLFASLQFLLKGELFWVIGREGFELRRDWASWLWCFSWSFGSFCGLIGRFGSLCFLGGFLCGFGGFSLLAGLLFELRGYTLELELLFVGRIRFRRFSLCGCG